MPAKDTIKRTMKTYKTPSSADNCVGVEIEFSCPVPEEEAMEMIIEANLSKYITIGYDGSPPPGHVGYEWKVLVSEKEMETVLPAVGRLINSMGGMSNESCGLHVHLDMRKRNPEKVFNNLVQAQSILFGVADQRRFNGRWSMFQPSPKLKGAQRGKSTGINPHLSATKNTIEVRIREGIVDGDDMVKWAKLLVSIADSGHLDKTIKTVSDLEANVRLARYVKDYVKERIEKNKRTDLLEQEVA